MKIFPKRPISCGILLSYRCTNACRHCMYACSPNWEDRWISEQDLRKILEQLAGSLQGERGRVGINLGLHFTGGEPFLNFELLLKATSMARELQVPSVFAETNGFWCTSDEVVREKMRKLREAGMDGILVSVNPFTLEHVPFERTERAVRIGKEVFGGNLLIYQEIFYEDFKRLGVRGTMGLEEYFSKSPQSFWFAELLPMGRAAYTLSHLFERFPARRFFGQSCLHELTRDWHVHIDNFCNYIPGYCAGISLGDARELGRLCEEGIELEDKPVLEALATDLEELFDFAVKEFNYRELEGGYISKCHLCLDIRRWIALQTNEVGELRPREFYAQLSSVNSAEFG